ncbi:MAG: hypothetical protein IAG13_00655, partial [Deltaproteobacteria bacterium]|nr:hypothetical protein [Nannocystaceae bacterium]
MNAHTRLSLVFVLALAACDVGLPDPYRVLEPRILAARFAVQGDESDDARAQVLPEEVLTIEPLLVDSGGRIAPPQIDALWLACALAPGQAPFACLQQAIPLTPSEIPRCPALDPSPSWIDPPEFPWPCAVTQRSDGTAVLGVPPVPTLLASGALELTFIAGVPGGTSTQRCAEELLAGAHDVPADCLYGVHLAAIGPPHTLVERAAEHGVELPEVPTPPRNATQADRNPRIAEFIAAVRDADERRDEPIAIGRGDVIEVVRGDTLELRTTSPQEDLQRFGVPVNGGASFDVATEAYTGRWYVTWGELLSDVSLDAESTNEWTIEATEEDDDEGPQGGLAHLTYVVRDGRGGV